MKKAVLKLALIRYIAEHSTNMALIQMVLDDKIDELKTYMDCIASADPDYRVVEYIINNWPNKEAQAKLEYHGTEG